MEHIVEEIIGKSANILTNEQQELLLFLYENLHIEALGKEDQTNFMESFVHGETLSKMAPFKSSLVEMIQEIEQTIPEFELEKHLPDSKERKYCTERKLHGGIRNEQKKQIIIKENIIYIPFDK